ncbi:DNA helicase UvrD [candidate division WOR-3 bacterium]|nr:DNA helicase UvrD [candidate division WOR-3 bacterium]
MQFIADLHIHSRFSRATSRDMEIPQIAVAAKTKGIKLVGAGDFAHPEYYRSLKQNLKPTGNGLFTHDDTYFILNVELNGIYSAGGRLRRIHNLVFVPSFETAERLTTWLDGYGKLSADGRPTLGLASKDLLAKLLELDPRAFLVPAHIWTPWFSLYGSNSGFDSIEECFGDLSSEVFAVETGLSSDPPMNWRLSALDSRTLISNSDAHSPSRLGREANVFDCELSYDAIREALRTKDRQRLLYTIEFFPEEGKYHYDGHRACGVSLAPAQSLVNDNLCPVCGRQLTIGVLHRVEQLADRKPEQSPLDAIPFRHLVPLEEVIAEALGVGRDTGQVHKLYETLVRALGSEFEVLLNAPTPEIERHADDRVALGIDRMRRGEVQATAGYDGVFGVIQVLPGNPPTSAPRAAEPGTQLGLFG